MTADTIIIDLSGHYNGLSGSQYSVIIDPEDRKVTDYCAIGAGVPMYVWHHRAVGFAVKNNIVIDELLQALQSDEAQEIIAGIMDLYRGSSWDGSNHVGTWETDEHGEPTDEWHALEHQLEALLASVPAFIDAGDYAGDHIAWDSFAEFESLSSMVEAWTNDAAIEAVWIEESDLRAVFTDWLTDAVLEIRDMDEEDIDEEDASRLALADKLLKVA